MSSRTDLDSSNQWVGHPRCRSSLHLKCPSNHLNLARTFVALAGVEPSIFGEGWINSESHQPRFTAGPEVCLITGDCEGLASTGRDQLEASSALGHEERTVGKRLDVPRNVQPGSNNLGGERRSDGEARSVLGQGEHIGNERSKWETIVEPSGPERQPARFRCSLLQAEVHQNRLDSASGQGLVFG